MTQLPSGLVFTGGQMLTTDHAPCCDGDPGVIGHNILIGSHHFMRQYPQSV